MLPSGLPSRIQLLALLSLFGASLHAQDPPAPLKGIRGFWVVVGVYLEAKDDSAASAELTTYAELRLRQAEVPVYDFATQLADPMQPSLSISVGTLSLASGLTAIRSDVSVRQLARLVGSNREHTVAIWEAAPQIAIGGASKARQTIRELLEVQLDQFLNAYLAANPDS